MNCPHCEASVRNLIGPIWVCPQREAWVLDFGYLWRPGPSDADYLAFVIDGLLKERDEVDQVLGKALGYPEVGDGSVCTGEHTVVTLAREAASRLDHLRDSQWERSERD